MGLLADPAAVTSIEAYVNQAAALLCLRLAAEHRPGVIANLAVLVGIAEPLLEFPLSPDIEPAPVYEP